MPILMDYKPNKIINYIDRQYYLLIETKGCPISTLKFPIEIGLSDLSDMPKFFYGYTADELSAYLIKNDKKLSKKRKELFEDALIKICKFGQNAKMYLTYEESR